MTRKDFFSVLFDRGEFICFGKTKYDTLPSRYVSFDKHPQFFSINPLKGPRRDSNVTVYRNILLEFDHGTSDEQLAIIKQIPYSTLVHSGGKSYHAIISLETPLRTKAEYDDLVKAVYAKVPEADKTAKNPSRFSRAPGAIRDNGVEQRLVSVVTRKPNHEIYDWCGVNPDNLGKTPAAPTYRATHKLLPIRALAFVRYGAPIGAWNTSLFVAACDMFSVGYDKEEVVDICRMASGYLDKADLRTIESARKNVQSGS